MALIVGVLIFNVADESTQSQIPTLEILSGQLHQRRRWLICEDFNILFRHVALALVVDSARNQYSTDEMTYS